MGRKRDLVLVDKALARLSRDLKSQTPTQRAMTFKRANVRLDERLRLTRRAP